MDKHRVRKARHPDAFSTSQDHIFIEFELDRWLEIDPRCYPSITHEKIHAYLEAETMIGIFAQRIYPLAFASSIKYWHEAVAVSAA